MKKIAAILAFLISFTVFAVLVISTPSSVLYLLNWGEYISQDLVKQFEKEYSCQVIEEDVTSSEARYQKILSGATAYDVAIPGDYTVEQLYKEGYLKKRDVTNKDYPYLSAYQGAFQSSLSSLRDDYDVKREYYRPYFWGSYSLLYSTRKEGREKAVKEKGFSTLYDRSLLPNGAKVGRYDTSRWIVASYLLSKGRNPNLVDLSTGSEEGNLSSSLQEEIVSALKKEQFDEFGNDQLKRNVASGSLDLAFVQSGDFFDALYLSLSQSDEEVSFNLSVPPTTAAFFDSMVIPTTSKNGKLANAFIDFRRNPVNAFVNAKAIGYSPTLKGVSALYKESAENGEDYYKDGKKEVKRSDFLSSYPYYLDPLYQTKTVYRLKPKDNSYLTTCETIFNHLA